MARRFLVERLAPVGEDVHLDERAAHHARVLRAREGDSVVLFDGKGNEADAEIASVAENAIVCRIVTQTSVSKRARIVLVQALTKGRKLEGIVRTTTELGVVEMHLALTARTIARPSEVRAEGRVDRLERIAREAARQCNRSDVPAIHAPTSLGRILDRVPATARKVLFWEESKRPLDEVLPHMYDQATDETWVLIGPEGGLAKSEVEPMLAAGFVDVGLGPQVLRVETAAPVAIALVMDRLGLLR